jgi:hypothetical protein
MSDANESAVEIARRIIETLNPSPGHFMFGKIIPATEVDIVARALIAALRQRAVTTGNRSDHD